MLNWDHRRGMLHHTMSFTPSGGPASRAGRGTAQAMRVMPIGRALRLPGPSVLQLMSLVRAGTEAVITAALRMPWSQDKTELVSPRDLPYDQLWAVDDHGARYSAGFRSGKGRAGTWLGIIRLSPPPPADIRRLDLVGDGTHLIRLPLGDVRGPVQGPVPGEIITVLTEAGAIAPDSPVAGQLAALCRRFGAAGHGIAIAPVAQIPAPWASVIDAPVLASGPEVFAALACVLPDVDGARFALAGLSSAGGESHLHVVGSGMAPLADRYQWNWTPGFSWWLRAGARNWHVAAAGEPHTVGDDVQAFRLRLTPPLAAVPDTAEVVVTGPATRIRATVPIRPA
jgi:hypothetical protein